ncbi:hypothetical protein CBF34_07670 [Vagococcus penaei]|uniref:Uncharacterized protein n=1 Tax=Vagococcus penaei TaxID=633807 RepID=A0A1Q2D475_9ENTE|nr:aminodeoxychorismate/anthranilate synthase component II [Vagococcus penaei]AQP53168.1 hypothetical protein BW732_02255 [Vagococcus penaei]RSU00970.1 hypothetical protein CBF34_07670 [Vagococcus penaei]
MLLIIDHYDSFTYNLYQYFLELDEKVSIVPYHLLKTLDNFNDYSAVILSPGPGSPTDYPDTLNFLKEHLTNFPILGVCLGHQMLAEFFSGKVVHSTQVQHGKRSLITHNGDSQLFQQLPNTFYVGRYHSLMVTDIQSPLVPTAWTSDNIIMAMEHVSLPIMSVQFHPESVLTENGHDLLRNFLTTRRQAC